MKKVVLGLFILLVSFSVYGQSLDETKDWMVRKIAEFSKDRGDDRLSFDGTILIYRDGSGSHNVTSSVSLLELDENSVEVRATKYYFRVTVDSTDSRAVSWTEYISSENYHDSGNTSFISFYFRNQEIAEKFKRALVHAITIAKEEDDLF